MNFFEDTSYYDSGSKAASADLGLAMIADYFSFPFSDAKSEFASADRSLSTIANYYVSSEAYNNSSTAAVDRSLMDIGYDCEYAETLVDRLYAKSFSIDPVYARIGQKLPTGDGIEIGATIRVRESLEWLEESLSKGIEHFARARAEFAELKEIPPQLRTQALNDTSAHFHNVLRYHYGLLLTYSHFKGNLEEKYWEAPFWEEAESGIHLGVKIKHGLSLDISEPRYTRKGDLAEILMRLLLRLRP
jgi:hypothetical protein